LEPQILHPEPYAQSLNILGGALYVAMIRNMVSVLVRSPKPATLNREYAPPKR